MIVNLGPEKKVEISFWRAKTKKDFIKLFKEKEENVSEQDIIDILIKPYIDNKEIWLSPEEVQYILIKIRELSIEDNLNFSVDCTLCNNSFNIDIPINELYTFKENNFPVEIKDYVTFRELYDSNIVEEFKEKYKNEYIPLSLIIMLLHIENYKNTKITSFEQILEIYNNLTFKEEEILNKTYNENKASLDIEGKFICPHCETSDTYKFDVIPTFFDPILP